MKNISEIVVTAFNAKERAVRAQMRAQIAADSGNVAGAHSASAQALDALASAHRAHKAILLIEPDSDRIGQVEGYLTDTKMAERHATRYVDVARRRRRGEC